MKGPDFNATVAGFWVMGAMFAWAIRWRWAGGLAAAVVLCAVDLAIRDTFTQSNYGNLFLLMIGGPIIGYVCESLQRSAMAVAAAERTAATEAERARLARAVHDGVLQVLALVQRRGGELGGEAGELGRAGRRAGAPAPGADPRPGLGASRRPSATPMVGSTWPSSSPASRSTAR